MKRLSSMQYQVSGIRLIISCFLLLVSFTSYAQTKQDLEQKKKKLTNEIEYTRSILNETKKNKEATLNELETLEKQIQSREQLIATINSEMSFIDEQINKNSTKISSLHGELQQLKDEYARMIYYAYKNRSAYGTLIFIFSAKDFNDAYNRLKYIKRYTEYRKKQADVIQSTSEVLKLKLQELETIKRNKRRLLGEEEVEKKTLDSEKNEQSMIVQKLQKKEKELNSDLKKKQKAADNLNKAIENIIQREIAAAKRKAAAEAKKKAEAEALKKAEAAKKAKAENKPVAPDKPVASKPVEKEAPVSALRVTPEAVALSKGFEGNQGKLPWPVEKGVIISTFGEHPHPVLKGVKTMNNGLNIKTAPGSAVRALFEGTVTSILNIPGMDNVVLINHGEYYTVYSNLKTVNVKTDQKVNTKQTIGTVATDEENKTEVHIEIWRGELKLNPANWIVR